MKENKKYPYKTRNILKEFKKVVMEDAHSKLKKWKNKREDK